MKVTTSRRIPFVLLGCMTVLPLFANAADDKKKQPDKTREVKIESLTLNIPQSWEQTPPSNKLRKAQFNIPKAKGDKEGVELAIFSFGGGGSARANIERWVGQFESKGRKSKITSGDSPQGQYIFVDITGTYKMSIGPPIAGRTKLVPNARMLAVILAVEKTEAVYYLRMAGESKTISAAAEPFRASFGADTKTEKEVKN
jgi:hypothetical protein